jgi:hypothetical protein
MRSAPSISSSLSLRQKATLQAATDAGKGKP